MIYLVLLSISIAFGIGMLIQHFRWKRKYKNLGNVALKRIQELTDTYDKLRTRLNFKAPDRDPDFYYICFNRNNKFVFRDLWVNEHGVLVDKNAPVEGFMQTLCVYDEYKTRFDLPMGPCIIFQQKEQYETIFRLFVRDILRKYEQEKRDELNAVNMKKIRKEQTIIKEFHSQLEKLGYSYDKSLRETENI